jgi:O-methyltransferase involved in polyketide biosynthesis
LGFGRHISDSAFLVNVSRSLAVELSLDRFARLWVTEQARRLWDAFSREVYALDALELALRNRFFLSRLEAFVAESPGAVLVNLGAGFTSYPFLTERPLRAIEVDLPHVVEFKRRRVGEFKEAGALPGRDVEWLAADLADSGSLTRLSRSLAARLGDAPSFVVLEGLSYYLPEEALARLLATARDLQRAGSRLALDFWTSEVRGLPVFRRFTRFLEERCGHPAHSYTFLDERALSTLSGYRPLEFTDIQALEREFSGAGLLADGTTILPEHYAVLERVA